MKKIHIKKGIDLNYHYTTSFKVNTFSIYFFDNEKRFNSSEYNCLGKLLSRTSQEYKTTADIYLKRKELYSTIINFGNIVVGDNFGLECRLNFIDERFDKDLANKAMNFFLSLLKKPNITNGLFDENYFEIVKNEIKLDYQLMLDDKENIAEQEFRGMCDQTHPYSLFVSTLEERINNLDNKRVVDCYNYILNKKIVINYCGNMSEESIVKLFDDVFEEREDFEINVKLPYPKSEEQMKIVEHNNFDQSVIRQLYLFDSEFSKEELLVFNCVFGQNSSSQLFRKLREEYGLCYTVYSAVSFDARLIDVFCECKSNDYVDCINFISDVIKELADDGPSDEEMELAFASIDRSFDNLFTRPSSIFNKMMSNYVAKDDRSLEEQQLAYHKVTKDDVKQVARSMVRLINYALMQGAEDGREEV